MRKHRIVQIFVVTVILLTASNSLVSAQPLLNIEVIEQYYSLESKFMGEILESEWIYVITKSEFDNDSNLSMISRENWFHITKGRIDVLGNKRVARFV